MSRIARLRTVLGREGDPYLRGRAMQVGGVALVADSLIGIDNPLDGRRKRSSIVGAFVVVVFAVVFIVALGYVHRSTQPYSGGLTTRGSITAVHRVTSTGTRSTGNSCTATVSYTVGGQDHQVDTGESSTSLCSLQGSTVTVSYRADQPAAGRPLIASTASVLRYALIGSWVLLVIGVLTVLVKLVETSVGAVLLLEGRRLVRRSPAVPADRIVEELRRAWQAPTRTPTTG